MLLTVLILVPLTKLACLASSVVCKFVIALIGCASASLRPVNILCEVAGAAATLVVANLANILRTPAKRILAALLVLALLY